MSKTLHEKVTEILGHILDLPRDEAIAKIEKECAGDDMLKKEVLSLYEQIIDRDDVPEELKKLFFNCIHFNPDDRPENIEALISILEDLEQSNPWTRKDSEKWWKSYDVYG